MPRANSLREGAKERYRIGVRDRESANTRDSAARQLNQAIHVELNPVTNETRCVRL